MVRADAGSNPVIHPSPLLRSPQLGFALRPLLSPRASVARNLCHSYVRAMLAAGAAKRRQIAARCFLIALLAMAFACVLAPAAWALSESDWLGRINEIRTGSQLQPVVEEPAWSAGILAHLEYMRQTPSNFDTGPYRSAHTENPASPFYSEEGAKEAESSDLGGGHTNVEAIDGWLGAPFHAIGMLRPTLKRVAFARDPQTGTAGLDVISGLEYFSGPPQQVLFPGPGSTIDLSAFTGEFPSPIETCTAQHPGADYESPGLPVIALLSDPPSPELSATMSMPDGAQISSSGPELCVVTEGNFVTKDPIYGPTGAAILSGDQAVFVISREHLTAGSYSVDIAQPGRPDISWSFQSRPQPEPVTRSFNLALRVRGARVSFRSAKALLGQRLAVTIRREWVPCATVRRDPRCTWTQKGHIRRRAFRLSRSSFVHFHPPGRWEEVLISARAKELVVGRATYPPASALRVIRGPRPHHAAH